MGKRGGARTGAGRPKTTIALPTEIALRVFERIPELGLVGVNKKPVQTVEDFALDLLSPDSALRKVEEHFRNMLERGYGKPIQKTEDLGFDPDRPLRVVVEHFGRSQNKVAAQAKRTL